MIIIQPTNFNTYRSTSTVVPTTNCIVVLSLISENKDIVRLFENKSFMYAFKDVYLYLDTLLKEKEVKHDFKYTLVTNRNISTDAQERHLNFIEKLRKRYDSNTSYT